jgi:hypothetical protein
LWEKTSFDSKHALSCPKQDLKRVLLWKAIVRDNLRGMSVSVNSHFQRRPS